MEGGATCPGTRVGSVLASRPFEISNFQLLAHATPQSAIGRGGAAIVLRILPGFRAKMVAGGGSPQSQMALWVCFFFACVKYSDKYFCNSLIYSKLQETAFSPKMGLFGNFNIF
jgi:hypothetical protein